MANKTKQNESLKFESGVIDVESPAESSRVLSSKQLQSIQVFFTTTRIFPTLYCQC